MTTKAMARLLSVAVFWGVSLALIAALQFTPAQATTIKNAIAADPALAAWPNNSDGNVEVAKALNLPASPDFWVWRTSVSRDEFTGATSGDGTDFSWTGYIGRSQGERDAFASLFDSSGAVNPARTNVRAAITDIFSGAGGSANRTHLLTIARRKATRFERLFTTGTGSTATPGFLVLEGPVSGADLDAARVN